VNVDSYLSEVTKQNSSVGVAQFDELGISHGFWGKNHQDPMELSELNRPIQVHEKNIVESDFEGGVAGVEADGVYSSLQNHRIAVVTADCLPILLVDRDKTLIMAVHAGWRGLVAGVVQEAVQLFQVKQIDLRRVLVGLGPCISQDSYEVGEEVINAVKDSPVAIPSEAFERCLAASSNDGKSMLDISMLALMQLKALGVSAENISVVQSCTYKNENEWFSYRRDGKRTGRNYTWIEL